MERLESQQVKRENDIELMKRSSVLPWLRIPFFFN
jgi:hypothetical protein